MIDFTQSQILLAKEIVVDYTNRNTLKDKLDKITIEQVCINFYSNVEQNWKVYAHTSLGDGMLYEIIHNGNINKTTVNCYCHNDSYQI